jgi:hypothetical protein
MSEYVTVLFKGEYQSEELQKGGGGGVTWQNKHKTK